MAYPDNLAIKYTYDNLGRVQSVCKLTNNLCSTNYASFSYNQNDLITGVTFGNNLGASYAYNAVSRPSEIKLTDGAGTLLLLNYTYNAAGTIASVIGNSTNTGGTMFTVSEKYAYDYFHRLTNATVKSGATTSVLWYEYDSVGNRVRQSLNGILNYVYGSSNTLLFSLSPSTNTTYTYDSNGNLANKYITTKTSSESWSYSFDALNRLVKVDKYPQYCC